MPGHPRLLLSCAALLALAACGSSDHHGGVGGDVPLDAKTYPVDPDVGLTVTRDFSLYAITHRVGGVYRVNTADATGSNHEYYGSIYTRGTLVVGETQALESDDFISEPQTVASGTRLDFDIHGRGTIKSFTFGVSAEPAYFDLRIDGQAATNRTVFSSKGVVSAPDAMPFGLVESP